MKHCTFCLHNTFINSYKCASTSVMVRYAIRRKFSVVKVFPKLVLYGKYSNQRVVLRQNIALGFALCYVCLSPTLLHAIHTYVSCNTNRNALTYSAETKIGIFVFTWVIFTGSVTYSIAFKFDCVAIKVCIICI